MGLGRELVQFRDWYAKVAIVSALGGAGIELFMIKTGFYDTVTVLEAERRAEYAKFQAENPIRSFKDFEKLLEEKFR